VGLKRGRGEQTNKGGRRYKQTRTALSKVRHPKKKIGERKGSGVVKVKISVRVIQGGGRWYLEKV